MIMTTFEDDMDKVTDLMQAIIQENSNTLSDEPTAINNFRVSYNLFTEGEVENTLKKIKSAEVLAYLYRQAENIYIEDINGRYTPWFIKGEQAKDVISEFAKIVLTQSQYQEFTEMLY